MRKQGGGGGSCRWRNNITQVCALNYSGARFIAPIRGPILCTSMYTSPSGDWGGDLCVNTGVQPRDRNSYPVVNPDMHVQNCFVHFRCHESTQIGKYDQGLLSKHSININNKRRKYVACVSVYHSYLNFASPNNPGSYTLAHACRCLRPSLQIWHQLWRQYRFTISPKFECYLLSPIRPFPDIPPPLICCGPGGWGVSTYTVIGAGLPIKVEEIIPHFVVTCYDEASVAADKSMTYREGLSAASCFFRLGV